MKFLTFSWSKLHNSVFKLAEKIQVNEEKFDLIIAIARGGLTISHILSDFLQLPIASFTISTYKDLQQHLAPEISLPLGSSLRNKKILLVDDVCETGKTFIRGIHYLHELGAEDVKTATLFLKPWAKFIPEYYVKQTRSWIVFPFDMRETIEALNNKFAADKLTANEVKEKLADLKIPQKYIDLYLQ